MAAHHEDELRADLQRHYGIDWDKAEEHSAGHVAALMLNIPQGESATYAAIDPDAGWTREQVMLALLVNHIALLRWGMADRKSRGTQPSLVGPSWMTKGKMRKLAARTLPIDELMRVLSKPRKKSRG